MRSGAPSIRQGLFPVVALAGALLGAGVIDLPGASALSCVMPESDWAEFEIYTVESGDLLARIPYEGHRPGYGCNVGNMNALSGPWFAWVEQGDNFDEDGPVHVLDLATGEQASVHPTTEGKIHDLSIATRDALSGPDVFLLTEGEDKEPWVVEHHQAGLRETPASRQYASVPMEGDQVILHKGFAWELEDHDAASPSTALWNLQESKVIAERELVLSGENKPDWRLLAGDGRWLVFASGTDGSTNEVLPNDARVWVQDLHEDHADALPPLIGPDEPRYGDFEIDAPRLYHNQWDTNSPWSPDSLQVHTLPAGDSEVVDSPRLMRHASIDGGRIVTGNYLDEAPRHPNPWLASDAAQSHAPPPTVEWIPGPTLLSLILILTGIVSLGRTIRRPR